MEVIIDGYNLIGIDGGLRGSLEHKRNWLIQQLSTYRKAKGFSITVVFDGWRSGWVNEAEKKWDGVTIVYSRQGEKADSVIVRIARTRGSGCVVVSSDREIQKAVERFGAVAISSGDFSGILRFLERPFETDHEELDSPAYKKGNPSRLSKSERRRQDKLKKLRP
jgi:predicted RNA-binding protein with PIN domain